MKTKRVLVKFSGEALADEKNHLILDKKKLESLAKVVKKLHQAKIQVAIVIGAGNIWRGKIADSIGIERVPADFMGMLGTVINAVTMSSVLKNINVKFLKKLSF